MPIIYQPTEKVDVDRLPTCPSLILKLLSDIDMNIAI